ncbi:hypothetical protein WN944_014560 [Citrus x changshan-huyou]|uniref:Uncharacterized protein n=1 Tax=Citrus x changshan-huyou TaxID=2935761 RepID=A0AAP0QLN9_9ROSI
MGSQMGYLLATLFVISVSLSYLPLEASATNYYYTSPPPPKKYPPPPPPPPQYKL